MLEELSGATSDDLDTTEMSVEGSAPPIPCGVFAAVADGVAHTEQGHLGVAAMDAAAHMLGHQHGNRPAVRVYGDNHGVVDNINHIGQQSKGLRRVVRIISHLHSMVKADVVLFHKAAKKNQNTDGLSKQYTSSVQNAEALERSSACRRVNHWHFRH